MKKLLTVLVLGLALMLGSTGALMAGDPVTLTRTTNSNVITDYIPWSAYVDGMIPNSQDIVVYTDDYCFSNDHVVQALDALGLGYTLFYADPVGFENALIGSDWDIVLVNHNLVLAASAAWDDVLDELENGAKVAVATFDADGSDDASGFVDELYMAIGVEDDLVDVDYPNPIYGWMPGNFVLSAYTPLAAVVFDEPDTTINCYIDDGDVCEIAEMNAVQGWTPGYAVDMGATANRYNDCGSVFMSWLPDNYMDDDDSSGMHDSAELWMNIIQGFLTGATATEAETWGGLKTLYR